jgi:hypothetical protein
MKFLDRSRTRIQSDLFQIFGGLLLTTFAGVTGCSGSSSSDTGTTDATSGAGSVAGASGKSGVGGASATSSTAQTSAATSVGGATAAGGRPGAAGATSDGGTPATAGRNGGTAGNRPGVGGMNSSGKAGTGGATSEGGSTAAGGTSATGGSSVICGTVAKTYTVDSSATGESGILVTGSTAASQDTSLAESGAYTPASPATLSNVDITSDSGSASTSGDDQSFYGYNSAILVKSGGVLDYSCGSVTMSGKGNGIFAFNSTVTLNNVTIKTTGDLGHGVDATYGGKITLTNTNISTTKAHAAALSTDRGGGTIIAYGGVMTTEASDSPGVYSTGNIMATDAEITANGGEGVVIEGKNSVTLNNVKMVTKGSSTSPRGMLIYQSASGDASGDGGVLNMTGGSLAFTATTGTLFYTPTSTATINFDGVTVANNAPTLLDAEKDSRWNLSKATPVITLNASSTALTGNVVASSSFEVVLSLTNASALSGAINSANTALAVTLTMDLTSTWTPTATSYLTCLTNAGLSGTTVSNISGDNDVYYSSSSCSALGGKTYTFASGSGSLIPT